MLNAPLVVVPMAHKAAYLERYAEPDKGWEDRRGVLVACPVLGHRHGHGHAADAPDRSR